MKVLFAEPPADFYKDKEYLIANDLIEQWKKQNIVAG